MIKSETTGNLVRHYSDSGMMIKQVETGNLYDEAVTEINPDEAVKAVKILLGREHVE